MKNIETPTYRKIRRRITSLKKIDLNMIELENMISILQSSFTFPTHLWPQKGGGKTIFRARINEDEVNHKYIYEPFIEVCKISYNRNPRDYGRANINNKPMFYAANGLCPSVKEVCKSSLNEQNKVLFLTVGEWRLIQDIKVSIICNSNRTKKKGKELLIAYNALVNFIKPTISKSEFRIWKIKTKFFADEFAKKVDSGFEKQYMYSAIYSQLILNYKDDSLKADGIFYPSVAYDFDSYNVVYHKNLIDAGSVILEKAHHIKCTYVGKNLEPFCETIKIAKRIESNKTIIWD